jgi:3-deoxy-D-manno-octulosonic-acid transferase
LGVFFYNIFLLAFRAGLWLSSPFNKKAKKWLQGRKNIFERLEAAIPEKTRLIWMHCASLGEFEQGRPVIEQLRKKYPAYKILLTFFSPSGYEVRKDYEGADWVFYLPMDGPRNARRFLEIVQPDLVIFVKYEFWYYYLKKIKYRDIPLLLISALFRKDMSFFQWYGALQRKILSRFDHLFVQNSSSKKLIDDIGLSTICAVSGDTRFDRVAEIAEKFQPVPEIANWAGNSKVIVAGSTWPEDEEVLQKVFTAINNASLKLIIAPHEITGKHMEAIEKLFPDAIRFSQLLTPNLRSARVLIIDNIGMLSRLYRYGWITYVGGGLKSSGIHNVLEAAVYNKIVLFGPFYKKYIEAVDLAESSGAISFTDETELKPILTRLLADEKEYAARSAAAGEFVHSHKGATEKILGFIQEKRLLTN